MDMDKPLSRGLRNLFMIHAVFGFLLGIPLWLVPGRFLELAGWVPAMVQLPDSQQSVPGQTFVDAVLARLLGIAVVALAVSSCQGYRARDRGQVEFLVQMEAVFCVLGSISIIVTSLFLMDRPMPPFGWIVAAFLAVFAVAWVAAMRTGPTRSSA
jgi:hypothetical protein